MKKAEVFEVFPFGVTLGLDVSRPILIFRSRDEDRVVPIALSTVEAGLAVWSESDGSPHALAIKVLEDSGLKVTKCTFIALHEHEPFVEVEFRRVGERKQKLRLRADQAVSYCLHARVRFYCSMEFFRQNRHHSILPTLNEMQKSKPSLLN